jgi:hypothetical protein
LASSIVGVIIPLASHGNYSQQKILLNTPYILSVNLLPLDMKPFVPVALSIFRTRPLGGGAGGSWGKQAHRPHEDVLTKLILDDINSVFLI